MSFLLWVGAAFAGTPTEVTPRTKCQVAAEKPFAVLFDKVEIESMVQVVADVTCRTFIVPDGLKGKISLVGPENGKAPMKGEELYRTFVAALDLNGWSVTNEGRFLRLVEKSKAKQSPLPTITDPDAPMLAGAQMMTRVFRIKYAEVEPLRGVLTPLLTPGGELAAFPPDLLLVNDTADNLIRLDKLLRALDVRPGSEELRTYRLVHAAAADFADKAGRIFDAKGAHPGPASSPPHLFADERTNQLIAVGAPGQLERIETLLKTLDVDVPGDGKLTVYRLENAVAKDVLASLQPILQGAGTRAVKAPVPAGGAAPSSASGEFVTGEVKLSADDATNTLLVVASPSDQRSVSEVIRSLDAARRQVYIEVALVETSIERDDAFSIRAHRILGAGTDKGGLYASTNQSATASTLSPAGVANLPGLAVGLSGAKVAALSSMLGGLAITDFGLVLNAVSSSSDANVLSMPHIVTTDNKEAQIVVGQKVPFRQGVAPPIGAGGANVAVQSLSQLYTPVTREKVELKITVKPHIGEGDTVTLDVDQEDEELTGDDEGGLGPITANRSAKTTVVARDDQTLVLGGIVQDRLLKSVHKVPILGDLPLVGRLFRDESEKKLKTNLLIFLTPHIIRSGSDFDRIRERKTAEREKLLTALYGELPDLPFELNLGKRRGPLQAMLRAVDRETSRLENGGPGLPGEHAVGPKAEPSS